MNLATPALAFADTPGRTGIDLLKPVLGEWIPMLIAFIVLWIVLAKLAWPAFIGMIDKRTATVKDSLERAENAKIESERLLEQQRNELDGAKKQAAQIIADAKQAAEAVKSDITAQAQVEAEQIIAKARTAVEAEKKAAIAVLQSSVADLTVGVAGRLIGHDLSDKEHRQIIERYLVEAGSLNAN
jgi:F-type H+-transporting ATPase subunit b